MAKIRIREQDLTTNSRSVSLDNAVYYPLEDEEALRKILDMSEDPIDFERELALFVPKTYGSVKDVPGDLKELITDPNENVKHPATIIYNLLNSGAKVVIGYKYSKDAEYIADRNQYDIKFLMYTETEDSDSSSSGEEEDNDPTELDDALNVACARRDCYVVISAYAPYLQPSTLAKLKVAFTDYSDFAENKALKGKYATAFYVKDAEKQTKDGTAYLAGEAYVAEYFASIAQGNPSHLSIAGASRGNVEAFIPEAGFIKAADLDKMQARTSSTDEFGNVAVNPIFHVNPFGVRIWGNRTCYPNTTYGDGTTDELVASSFLNIRSMLCDLKKLMYKTAKMYQFEQNNDVLWVNFQNTLYPELEKIKQSYGIGAYRWVQEETTERAKLKAKLQIIGIEAVEDFDLTVELANNLEVTVGE